MPKPTRWLAGWLVLRLTLAPAPESAAWAWPGAFPEPAAPELSLARLASGPEPCAVDRPDVREALARQAERRAEGYRALVAGVVRPHPGDRPPGPISGASLRTLRAAGISPDGFDPAVRSSVLAHLRGTPALRRAFREAFGDPAADHLDRLLREDGPAEPRALVLGNSVVIPNRADAAIRAFGHPLRDAVPVGSPRVLGLREYRERLTDELSGLEADRMRYLESAARAGRTTASVRSFARSLRRLGEGDAEATAARARAAGDHAALLTRLRTLQLELGADPVLGQRAREGVAEASSAGRACADVGERRQRWIYLGAGGVTALVGAAGLVVATGATGTMPGGVVIAAAIEASLGAYLLYRTERDGSAAVGAELPEEPEPAVPEAEKRRFRAADGEAELSRGRLGSGRGSRSWSTRPRGARRGTEGRATARRARRRRGKRTPDHARTTSPPSSRSSSPRSWRSCRPCWTRSASARWRTFPSRRSRRGWTSSWPWTRRGRSPVRMRRRVHSSRPPSRR